MTLNGQNVTLAEIKQESSAIANMTARPRDAPYMWMP